MFQFGIGGMWGLPNGGNAASPSFPQRFGTLQDIGVDMDRKLVELRGQNIDPDDVAPGDRTIKCKAGFANVEINTYNSLFFADTITTGTKTITSNEPVVGAATVPVAGHTTFYKDLVVRYANTGVQLVQVAAGSEVVGKYSVNQATGSYVFAGTDIGTALLIDYVITNAAGGSTLTVVNHVGGYGPTFEIWLSQPYQGANGMHFFSCRAAKMSAPMKRDGYLISDFEFQPYANPAGQVFEWFQNGN